MSWHLFEYAGQTVLARAAMASTISVLLLVIIIGCFLTMKRSVWWRLFPFPLLVLLLSLSYFFGPKLDHAWLYLQQNVNRSYSTYKWLTFATSFVVPIGSQGKNAFVHIATSDSGFAKGKPVEVTKVDGHLIARYEDEDYPQGVTTFDGRPVDTGFRFRASRKLVSLIPLFEMPGAKTFCVEGDEAEFYASPLANAGRVRKGTGENADVILVAPSPDWVLGSETPDAKYWKGVSSRLTRDGVAALHLDARLMSRARFKKVLADFKSVFSRYHLWCTGRKRYVVTSGANVLADEVLELFADEKASAAFMEADAFSPADIFASYVGTDAEIEPAFESIPEESASDAKWSSLRLAFVPQPTNHLAEVRVSMITPLDVPYPTWFVRGMVTSDIHSSITNAIMNVQVARREILRGFDCADSGSATNAVDHWSAAASVNPRDPLLMSLADSMDLEGRRYLKIGNVNAAIRCYENRLLIRPQDVAAVHNFGLCLKKSGHLDVAATVFAKAVTMDPRTDEHRYELVDCCASIHKEDMACRQLDVLMKRHPNDPALKMRAAKLLCLRSNKSRDESRAIKLAEEAVLMTGWKDPAYMQALADVYIDSGRTLMGVSLKKKIKEMRLEK